MEQWKRKVAEWSGRRKLREEKCNGRKRRTNMALHGGEKEVYDGRTDQCKENETANQSKDKNKTNTMKRSTWKEIKGSEE